MRRWLPLLLLLTLSVPSGAQTIRRAVTDYSYAVLTKTSNYSVTTSDGQNVLVLASNSITITLYAVSGNTGKTITVKNMGSGTITVDANSSETIDGALTQTISAANQSLTLVCTGSAWVLI